MNWTHGTHKTYTLVPGTSLFLLTILVLFTMLPRDTVVDLGVPGILVLGAVYLENGVEYAPHRMAAGSGSNIPTTVLAVTPKLRTAPFVLAAARAVSTYRLTGKYVP